MFLTLRLPNKRTHVEAYSPKGQVADKLLSLDTPFESSERIHKALGYPLDEEGSNSHLNERSVVGTEEITVRYGWTQKTPTK